MSSAPRGAKWRLLFSSLPLVVVVLAVRFVVHTLLDVNGVLAFADAGSVITGAALILGLMLGGVMGDYKESEKLPAALGGALGGFDGLVTRALRSIDADPTWARKRIGAIGKAVDAWLHRQIDDAAVDTALGDVSQIVEDLEKAGVKPHYIARLFVAGGDIGGALGRIRVIRDTKFMPTGYALMQMLVGLVLLLLVIVDFPEGGVEWLVTAVLSLVYIYMVRLVSDLDDPFEYANGGGAADVDLTPFKNALAGLHHG